jgi:signal transduction histidine kinase
VSWPPFLAPLAATLGFRIEGALPEAPSVLDADQLEQVIINLEKNAREPGSALEAFTLRVQHQSSGGVCLEVTDRGSGLSEQALRDALVPFFSTKSSGTGLGLTLCREIIEAHGGRLTLANRRGGGAVVAVYLP